MVKPSATRARVSPSQPRSLVVLLLLYMSQHVAAHSCYYWVNYDPAGPQCGGKSGIDPAAYAKCVGCADAADPAGHNCTAQLISNACRGVTPEPPGPPHPPPPPGPGALALTLLPEVGDTFTCAIWSSRVLYPPPLPPLPPLPPARESPICVVNGPQGSGVGVSGVSLSLFRLLRCGLRASTRH